MKVLLLPFKIAGVTFTALFDLFGLGLIGTIVAAVVNAWAFRMLACWLAWRFGWNFMSLAMLNIISIAAFIVTFGATKK
jgi:MFS-type transporter involved in bile tolerance (Atg22 family)